MLDKRTRALLLDDMAANAKLMKALRKDDDDAPRPQLAPSAPTSDMGTLKLKKSTLTGIASWDDLDGKLEHNSKHDFEVARRRNCIEKICILHRAATDMLRHTHHIK